MSEDYPYNTDYTPAPRPKAKGEPATILSFPQEREMYDDLYDPYDDGLNPARGVINGVLMGVGLLIMLYVLYLGVDYSLTALLRG